MNLFHLTLYDANSHPPGESIDVPVNTLPNSALISSLILSAHTSHSGAECFSLSTSAVSALNQQRLYDQSLPVLLPLLVRTILPKYVPCGSLLTLSLLGPGATALGLSVLSLPTRDDDDLLRLPGDIHLTSIEVSVSPFSLPLLPEVNPLANVKPTATKLIIYDETAISGESNMFPSSLSPLSSKVPIQIVPPKTPTVTYFLSEDGAEDGFKKYVCTFFIPRSLLSYRACCELTLHPISTGGSYYEVRLGSCWRGGGGCYERNESRAKRVAYIG